jgi:hypothetical protein
MTAMVLDELRSRFKDSIDHLYAIVGVSGGSVGAASFVAAVRDGLPAFRASENSLEADSLSSRGSWQQCLQKDLLGPTVKAMLGGDFISQFFSYRHGRLIGVGSGQGFRESMEYGVQRRDWQRVRKCLVQNFTSLNQKTAAAIFDDH